MKDLFSEQLLSTKTRVHKGKLCESSRKTQKTNFRSFFHNKVELPTRPLYCINAFQPSARGTVNMTPIISFQGDLGNYYESCPTSFLPSKSFLGREDIQPSRPCAQHRPSVEIHGLASKGLILHQNDQQSCSRNWRRRFEARRQEMLNTI